MSSENRRFMRIRPSGLMSKTGKIFADFTKPVADCDVVDISAGGAHLFVRGSGDIPPKFVLHYSGAKKWCRAVWVKGRRVGVAF
jgi:hypothetical protein